MKITMYLFGVFNKIGGHTTYCSDGLRKRLAQHRLFLKNVDTLIVGDIVKVELPLQKERGKKGWASKKR